MDHELELTNRHSHSSARRETSSLTGNGPHSDAGSEADVESLASLRKQKDTATEFKGRHIQMMALGLSIGSGLFYQSGQFLGNGGPVSLLLAFLAMGSVLYSITLGEMISFLPLPGSIFTLANRFLTPGIGFAGGWFYCFGYAVDFPNKAVVFANYMSFWSDKPRVLWISIFFVFPIGFNILNVRRYGEVEYWFTAIKVVTIVGLSLAGLLIAMDATGTALLGTDANLRPVSCAENVIGECLGGPGFGYWREEAFTPEITTGPLGYLAAFWDCCTIAVFAYSGIEVIGITADETERQRYTLPRAARRVSHRIIFYYTLAIFVLGLTVSANDPLIKLPSSGDPIRNFPGGFIIMAERAGIRVLPSIINVVMIIAALSTATANLYVTSRSLFALAKEGHAPKFLEARNRLNVPWKALILACLPGALAYLSIKEGSNNVLSFLAAMTTSAVLIPWAIICATYIRYRKIIQREQLQENTVEEANSPLQPYLAYYGLTWCIFILLFQGFKAFNRSANYWSTVNTSWGYALASYSVIAGFILLLLLSRLKPIVGSTAFKFRRLDVADYVDGMAPPLEDLQRERSQWRRAVTTVLNFI